MIKVTNYADRAEIYIYGIIIDDTDATLLDMADVDTGYDWPSNIRKQLDELKGKPLDVHIASDGGNVAAGIAIYNLLKQHDAPVTVYIDSWAASIASVIALAGNTVKMPANTFMMVHNPSAFANGDSAYLRSVADWLDKLRDMIVNTYKEASSTLTVERIRELMDAETWFTAQEASELFDKIELLPSNDLQAVACYKSAFKSAPEAVNKATANDNGAVNSDVDEHKNVINEEIIKVLQEAYKL